MYDTELSIYCNPHQGYCIVSGLADPALLQQCTDFLHAKWDTVDKCGKDFGSNGECEFPCGEVIDKLTGGLGLYTIYAYFNLLTRSNQT